MLVVPGEVPAALEPRCCGAVWKLASTIGDIDSQTHGAVSRLSAQASLTVGWPVRAAGWAGFRSTQQRDAPASFEL